MKKNRISRKDTPDSFSKLLVIQTIMIIIAAILIFAVSRLSDSAFIGLQEDISYIFRENYDHGGYYTPKESSEYSRMNAVFSEEALTAKQAAEEACEKEAAENSADSFRAHVPVVGEITSAYGSRIHPVYGEESFHSGTDIAATEGSPVYAVLDGVVVSAGLDDTAGYYIRLKHENSLETLYCHCSELYVREGINIRRGEVIAAVGMTGLATGPHLHFELYENSERTDPDRLLAEAVYAD